MAEKWIDVEEWGRVRVITVNQAARLFQIDLNTLQWWIDNNLVQCYLTEKHDEYTGVVIASSVDVDYVDAQEIMSEAKRYPDSPYDRVLWKRFERKERAEYDTRSTDRTMVQPQDFIPVKKRATQNTYPTTPQKKRLPSVPDWRRR